MNINTNDLIRAREESPKAYIEFTKLVREYPQDFFCFFEGKDNPYYYQRIKQETTLTIHPIKCNGRQRVLKAYELINYHEEYDKYKKAFFIDRDFNPPLPPHHPPIFETPCYSIENFYVSVEVFKEIMKNEFNLSAVSDSYQVCLTLFIDRQQEFHTAVTLFNSWYACLIDIRNTTEQKTGVNLDDKLPKGFINFTLQSVSANYDLKKIKQTYPNALQVAEEVLNQKIADFSACEQDKVFRGKYEMEFLLTFIELILQDARGEKKYLKDKIKFSFSEKITHEKALNIFSGYAETPQTLIDYLKRITQ